MNHWTKAALCWCVMLVKNVLTVAVGSLTFRVCSMPTQGIYHLFTALLSLTTTWVRIQAWACEKVASDLGLGSGSRRVLRFPPQLTTG